MGVSGDAQGLSYTSGACFGQKAGPRKILRRLSRANLRIGARIEIRARRWIGNLKADHHVAFDVIPERPQSVSGIFSCDLRPRISAEALSGVTTSGERI